MLVAGLAKPLPETGDFHEGRYAWMVAGGPLATLLLLAASGISYWWLGPGAPAWLTTLGWCNFLIALSCLVPYRIGPIRSDANWLLLLRRPKEARSAMAFMQVMAQEAKGVLPREWDAEVFETMMAGSISDASAAFRHLLAFYRRMDEGQEAEALRSLEQSLAASGLCGRAIRYACFMEAACSSGLLRRNADNARAWLADARKLRKPLTKSGVEAAIAVCEGRYADAIKHWDAALDFLARRKLDSGLARWGKNVIVFRRGQCQEALERAAGSAETASV
jgi:hypothetical protein